MGRIRLNITIEEDTRERLQQFADENHTTISRAIENWIWSEELKTKHSKVNGANMYHRGILKYNPKNERYGLFDGSKNKWIDDGFHCGECLQAKMNGRFVETRMEMSCEQEWYLVGLEFDKLDGVIVRIKK